MATPRSFGMLSLTQRSWIRICLADTLQPGDHPQQGGFGAAGRADEHHKFPVLNVQIDAVQRVETVGVDFLTLFN